MFPLIVDGSLLNFDVYCYFGCITFPLCLDIYCCIAWLYSNFFFFFLVGILRGTWALVRNFQNCNDSIMLMLNISNVFSFILFFYFTSFIVSFAVLFFWFQSFTFISFSVQLHGLVLLSHLVISFVSVAVPHLCCCTCISFIFALSFHSFVWLHFISFH